MREQGWQGRAGTEDLRLRKRFRTHLFCLRAYLLVTCFRAWIPLKQRE